MSDVYWSKWKRIAKLPGYVNPQTRRIIDQGDEMPIKCTPAPEGEYGVGSQICRSPRRGVYEIQTLMRSGKKAPGHEFP